MQGINIGRLQQAGTAVSREKGSRDTSGNTRITFVRSLKSRLILFFLLVGVIPAVVVGLVSYQKASSSLTTQAYHNLEAVRDIKASQVEGYFGERIGDIMVLSASHVVMRATVAYQAAFDAEGGAEKGPLWAAADDEYGPWLAYYEQVYGCYDLFLIGAGGDIVYTVERESDLGQSLTSGTG